MHLNQYIDKNQSLPLVDVVAFGSGLLFNVVGFKEVGNCLALVAEALRDRVYVELRVIDFAVSTESIKIIDEYKEKIKMDS